MQEERRVIAKRFPKGTILVNKIPFVEADTLKIFVKLRKSDCWDAMKNLSMDFQEFPAKKALNGGSISGTGRTSRAGKRDCEKRITLDTISGFSIQCLKRLSAAETVKILCNRFRNYQQRILKATWMTIWRNLKRCALEK